MKILEFSSPLKIFILDEIKLLIKITEIKL